MSAICNKIITQQVTPPFAPSILVQNGAPGTQHGPDMRWSLQLNRIQALVIRLSFYYQELLGGLLIKVTTSRCAILCSHPLLVVNTVACLL
jgi:hypothetical protein